MPSSSATHLLADITEKEWQAQVKDLASLCGFRRAYHTFDSRRSDSGFPDLVLVRDRIIYAELKREKGKPTDAQKEWLDALASAGGEVYLWRPADLDEVANVLRIRWKFGAELDGRRLLRTELEWCAPGSLWMSGRGRVDGQ